MILFEKGLIGTFYAHNPSKLDHKQPDPDHPKAQDKRSQAIFVSGRISETFFKSTSVTRLSVKDKKNNILSFGGFITYTIIIVI